MSVNDVDLRPDSSTRWARRIAGLSWQAIRLPLLAFLMLVEPIVSFVLTLVGMIGIVVSFFSKFAGPPNFPFWLMLGISIGCGVFVIAIKALLRSLAR